MGGCSVRFVFCCSEEKKTGICRNTVYVSQCAKTDRNIAFRFGRSVVCGICSGIDENRQFTFRVCGSAVWGGGSFFVQYLIELAVKKQGVSLLRRKGQFAAVSIAAACIGPAMMFGARFYDGYFPKEAEAVSVVIEGVGMSRDEYEMLDGQENTVTEKYLYRFRMTGEGKK